MHAVNLIPPDQRRDAGGAAGRSGGAAYVLLGGLAVLVILVALFTLAGRSVDDKKADLARIEAEASATEARATQFAAFTQFANLRATRTQTVTSLAASRFDWSHAMGELSRVVPNNVWLTSLQGTVAPGVALKGGAGGSTSALRAQLPVPAVEMVGCSTDQTSVARMMVRMRLIDAVSRVALQSSSKADTGGSGGSAGGAGADCRYGSTRYPQFNLVVFFDQAAGAVPTTADVGTTGATGTSGATGAASVPTSFGASK